MSAERRQVFNAALEAVAPATSWADGRARAEKVDGDTAYAIQLCVEELATNSVLHGKRQKPGWFAIDLRASSDTVTLVFEDDAAPFDITQAESRRVDKPLSDVAPGGLGIGLVKSMSSDVRYVRRDDVNVISVEFRRPD